VTPEGPAASQRIKFRLRLQRGRAVGRIQNTTGSIFMIRRAALAFVASALLVLGGCATRTTQTR